MPAGEGFPLAGLADVRWAAHGGRFLSSYERSVLGTTWYSPGDTLMSPG